jgi:hypothetical protein
MTSPLKPIVNRHSPLANLNHQSSTVIAIAILQSAIGNGG